MKRIILLCMLFLNLSAVASEQYVVMVRSAQPFPEAMSTLQNAVIDHKYTLSRVQRVDVGLEKAGFKTDRYRIVFFGKQEEMKKLTDRFPELGVYLPLKVVIFAEEEDTMLVALNPTHFGEAIDTHEYDALFKRWSADLLSILEVVRVAD